MVDGEFTRLLTSARQGDEEAHQQLLPKVYEELRTLAQQYMRRENSGHTLQATALVNEAYLKLLGAPQANNRAHFLALSAQAMRRILVDHARSKNREKRGGDLVRVTLTDWQTIEQTTEQSILELDEALCRLSEFDQRAGMAIELLFFGGLTYEEIGEQLGTSKSTAYDDIKAAKAWLATQMGDAGNGSASAQ